MTNPKTPRPWELLLIAQCLEWAADEFSNHGCNDVDESLYAACGLTNEEDIGTLLKEMQDWNGDEQDPHPTKLFHIHDWMLMRFFAHKLKEKAGNPDDD